MGFKPNLRPSLKSPKYGLENGAIDEIAHTWMISSRTWHSPNCKISSLPLSFCCVGSFDDQSLSMSILSSSPSLSSLKLFRLSIDAAFLGNRTKPSQSFRMDVVSSNSNSISCISVGEDFPLDYEQWLPVPDPESRRRAGVLLHPTSFRGPHGIGDLGEEALRFIDWLHSTGCSVWQVSF